ncbi:MAG TPA: FAD-binding oxidoreductase [Gemmatimonadaceae bacterium]|nr:FAD-binding oxidoreductase [Gemmatimonadaceae bacterium]
MSTEAVVSAVKESVGTASPLRIAGRATWLDAGRPVSAQKTLSLRNDSGVVGYVPGDLTLTVRAGTPLSEIEQVTRERDQWLPLDPYGTSDGTIGATLATASAGPLASSFGLPRDLLLGLEFVNGRGEVVRGGGKVVKNVAGFDLSRLLTGSWGTLGVITEVTLRLYALPKVDRTFAIALKGSEQETGRVIHVITESALSPYALQYFSRPAVRALELGEHPVCLIRFGGNDAVVRAQVNALSQIAKPEETESEIWTRVRQLDGSAHTVVRISSLPVQFRAASARILGDDVGGIYVSIDPRRGVLRIVVGGEDANGDSGTAAIGSSVDFHESQGVIFEKLPPDIWSAVSPSVVSDPLSQGIKRAYDPHNILNPGILGELM